ncbi:MAG: hypothetical protein C4290_13980 [Chloroflexota bacterium]
MAHRSSLPEAPAAAHPAALRAFTGLTILMAVLVLSQAALAGRFLNYSAENLRTLHGILGDLVLLLAIIQLVLLLTAGVRGHTRAGLLSMSITLLVLVVAQLVLGYAGREQALPAALHIPLGVLIFGLLMSNISLGLRAQRELSA